MRYLCAFHTAFARFSFTFFLEILQIYRIKIKTQHGDFGLSRGSKYIRTCSYIRIKTVAVIFGGGGERSLNYRIFGNSSTVLLLFQTSWTLYYYFCLYYYYFNTSISKNFASQTKKVASFSQYFNHFAIRRYISRTRNSQTPFSLAR